MDPTDSEILRLLWADGRLSWRHLGAAVGLSATAAADRVRRLRQAGVILGFPALIDPPRRSQPRSARRHHALPRRGLRPVRDRGLAVPSVIEVLHLTGAPDYQLRVACRDTAELDTAPAHAAPTPRRGGHRDDDRAALRSAYRPRTWRLTGPP